MEGCATRNLPTRAAPEVASRQPLQVEQTEEAVDEPVNEEEPTWPRKPVTPKPEPAPPPVRSAPVCVGDVNLAKEKPHRAACCYPARELLVRPIRAMFPELRACYEQARNAEAEGKVAFKFRIEEDGTIRRVCGEADTPLLDDDVVRCMAERLRTVRYEARTDDDVALCGLIQISYPVRFTHEGN